MTDVAMLLPLVGSALFFLAVLAIILWPILTALLEILKAVRHAVSASAGPRSFVLAESGQTIWLAETPSAESNSLSLGHERLRLSVLFACGMEAAFIAFFTIFVFRHSNPHGDGMEMASVGFAFMLIFLPLTLPAFLLARTGRWLVPATVLAALGAFAYFGLWLETLSEMGLPKG